VRLSVRPMLEGKGRERYEIRCGLATIAGHVRSSRVHARRFQTPGTTRPDS
jgi:hypothetical protein